MVFSVHVLSCRSLRCSIAITAHSEVEVITVSSFRSRFGTERSVSSSSICVSGIVSRVRKMRSFTFVDLIDSGTAADDTQSRPVQVVVSDAELTSGLRGVALPLLLRLRSGLTVRGVPGHTLSGALSLFASRLELRSLPPDPPGLLRTAQLVSCAALTLTSAAAATGAAAEDLDEIVRAIDEEEASGVPTTRAGSESTDDSSCASPVDRLCRQLSSRLRSGGTRRHRPPKFSKDELVLLDRLSGQWPAAEWPVHASTQLAPASLVASCLRGTLAPENGIPRELPAAEAAVRLAYVRDKKVPQLRWMLSHVLEMLAACDGAGSTEEPRASRDDEPNKPRHERRLIVDLGCGKGDFALLLAAALPNRAVLGVDTNREAIAAATTRACAADLANARFECGDATKLEGIEEAGIEVLFAFQSMTNPKPNPKPPRTYSPKLTPHRCSLPCTRAEGSATPRSRSPPAAVPPRSCALAASTSTGPCALWRGVGGWSHGLSALSPIVTQFPTGFQLHQVRRLRVGASGGREGRALPHGRLRRAASQCRGAPGRERHAAGACARERARRPPPHPHKHPHLPRGLLAPKLCPRHGVRPGVRCRFAELETCATPPDMQDGDHSTQQGGGRALQPDPGAGIFFWQDYAPTTSWGSK